MQKFTQVIICFQLVRTQLKYVLKLQEIAEKKNFSGMSQGIDYKSKLFRSDLQLFRPDLDLDLVGVESRSKERDGVVWEIFKVRQVYWAQVKFENSFKFEMWTTKTKQIQNQMGTCESSLKSRSRVNG